MTERAGLGAGVSRAGAYKASLNHLPGRSASRACGSVRQVSDAPSGDVRVGRVVILNGVSSAGKSTLAAGFSDSRTELGELWLVMGIDDFLAKLPAAFFKGGDHVGAFSDDGIRFEPTGDPDGSVAVRAGAAGQRLFAAYRRSVAACARAGFDVLVDEVAIDDIAVTDWADALAGLRTTWIAVRCDPDVAAERERLRGDRFEGLARGQANVVHRSALYDFEVDTTITPPEQLVAQLTTFLCP